MTNEEIMKAAKTERPRDEFERQGFRKAIKISSILALAISFIMLVLEYIVRNSINWSVCTVIFFFGTALDFVTYKCLHMNKYLFRAVIALLFGIISFVLYTGGLFR